MNRDALIRNLDDRLWDVIVIGGGATGLGVAVDAQSRGYRTLLLEHYDFAKATSSRSTKLVHGGVRYLKQGNIALVTEALRERGLMRRNAPHLVKNLAFVVPRYKWWEGPFYGVGLRLYDRLAGELNLTRSRQLSRQETIHRIPNIETEHLLGGAMYHDAQFDDARMALTLAETAVEAGATVLNYMHVTEVTKSDDFITGVRAVDTETGDEYVLRSRAVVNAGGIFADEVRRLDEPGAETTITTSQGVHLVLDRSFLEGETAIMVPQTDDGRVLFVIPWKGCVLVGTTDTPMNTPEIEPKALEEEIGFILRNAGRYLSRDPSRDDVLSVFAGQRPLVAPHVQGVRTRALSREHSVMIADSGLVTIIGGKWTTYRKMAQDTVDSVALIAGLRERPCVTETLTLYGWDDSEAADELEHLSVYGAERVRLQTLLDTHESMSRLLHPRLPYTAGQVIWAAQHEMARTVEDVLARRTRSLLLDAAASIEAAPRVAELLAGALQRPEGWVEAQIASYESVAKGYLPSLS